MLLIPLKIRLDDSNYLLLSELVAVLEQVLGRPERPWAIRQQLNVHLDLAQRADRLDDAYATVCVLFASI